MNKEIFKQLLESPESEWLDFKTSCYDFKQKETEEAKFIKDMLSFSNTIREGNAYIIFGVREGPTGKELIGVADFPDDAILQQKAKDKIYPKITFSSFRFDHQGLVYGVIQIPLHAYDEPLHSCQKLKGLEIGKIYLRRGSSNSEATGRETLAVQKWFETLSLKLNMAQSMGKLMTENIAKLTDHTVSLSTSMASALSLATAIDDADLKDFCNRELTGYPMEYTFYGEHAKHRLMEVVATPLTVELAPYHNFSAGALLKHMLKQEHFFRENFFFSKSLNELEEVLRNLKRKGESTLGFYQVDHQQMYPDSDRVDDKVSLFFDLAEVESLYERIRRVAINKLIHLSANR